ncbi:hypothetical protein ACFLTD_04610, partial [Elusimicrobiota bacterium]
QNFGIEVLDGIQVLEIENGDIFFNVSGFKPHDEYRSDAEESRYVSADLNIGGKMLKLVFETNAGTSRYEYDLDMGNRKNKETFDYLGQSTSVALPVDFKKITLAVGMALNSFDLNSEKGALFVYRPTEDGTVKLWHIRSEETYFSGIDIKELMGFFGSYVFEEYPDVKISGIGCEGRVKVRDRDYDYSMEFEHQASDGNYTEYKAKAGLKYLVEIPFIENIKHKFKLQRRYGEDPKIADRMTSISLNTSADLARSYKIFGKNIELSIYFKYYTYEYDSAKDEKSLTGGLYISLAQPVMRLLGEKKSEDEWFDEDEKVYAAKDGKVKSAIPKQRDWYMPKIRGLIKDHGWDDLKTELNSLGSEYALWIIQYLWESSGKYGLDFTYENRVKNPAAHTYELIRKIISDEGESLKDTEISYYDLVDLYSQLSGSINAVYSDIIEIGISEAEGRSLNIAMLIRVGGRYYIAGKNGVFDTRKSNFNDAMEVFRQSMRVFIPEELKGRELQYSVSSPQGEILRDSITIQPDIKGGKAAPDKRSYLDQKGISGINLLMIILTITAAALIVPAAASAAWAPAAYRDAVEIYRSAVLPVLLTFAAALGVLSITSGSGDTYRREDSEKTTDEIRKPTSVATESNRNNAVYDHLIGYEYIRRTAGKSAAVIDYGSSRPETASDLALRLYKLDPDISVYAVEKMIPKFSVYSLDHGIINLDGTGQIMFIQKSYETIYPENITAQELGRIKEFLRKNRDNEDIIKIDPYEYYNVSRYRRSDNKPSYRLIKSGFAIPADLKSDEPVVLATCMNVLWDYDKAAAEEAIQEMGASIEEGGYLAEGDTALKSLSDGTRLNKARFVIYRKDETGLTPRRFLISPKSILKIVSRHPGNFFYQRPMRMPVFITENPQWEEIVSKLKEDRIKSLISKGVNIAGRDDLGILSRAMEYLRLSGYDARVTEDGFISFGIHEGSFMMPKRSSWKRPAVYTAVAGIVLSLAHSVSAFAGGSADEVLNNITQNSLVSSFFYNLALTSGLGLLLEEVVFGAPVLLWIRRLIEKRLNLVSNRVIKDVSDLFGEHREDKDSSFDLIGDMSIDSGQAFGIEEFLREWTAGSREKTEKIEDLEKIIQEVEDDLRYHKLLAAYLYTGDTDIEQAVTGLLKSRAVSEDKRWPEFVKYLLLPQRRSKLQYLNRSWMIHKLLDIWNIKEPDNSDIYIARSLMEHPGRSVRRAVKEKVPDKSVELRSRWSVKPLWQKILSILIVPALFFSIGLNIITSIKYVRHSGMQHDIVYNRLRDYIPGYDDIVWQDKDIPEHVIPVFYGNFREVPYDIFEKALGVLERSTDRNALQILEVLLNEVSVITKDRELYVSRLMDTFMARGTESLEVFEQYVKTNHGYPGTAGIYSRIIDYSAGIIDPDDHSQVHIEIALKIMLYSYMHPEKRVKDRVIHALKSVTVKYSRISHNLLKVFSEFKEHPEVVLQLS